MQSVFEQVYQIHFYRVHHDLWQKAGRTWSGRTQRFLLPLLGCAIHIPPLKTLERTYRRDMRSRERLLQYLGVWMEDLGGKQRYMPLRSGVGFSASSQE